MMNFYRLTLRTSVRAVLVCLFAMAVAPLLLSADLPRDRMPTWPQPLRAPKNAPNIVLIMLDDVGFADTSTFGGLAQTPALTKLAAEGLRYNRFHVVGSCAPTRAALLGGRNHHRMGFGDSGEAGYPGYNGIWKKSTASIAEILRRNGYSTAAFGKWHNTPFREISPIGPFDHWPTSLGFEHYYGNMLGVSSQWEPELWRNTVPVQRPKTIEEGYHYTTDIVEEAIGWLNLQRSLAAEKPYFMYVATAAAHAPHHVPEAWVERYKGKFNEGWDALREDIFARQKKLGVIPKNATLSPRPKELPLWSSLTEEQKRVAARQMEVYAGFLAHADYEIGRLIDSVRAAPGGDNTLILYIVGDNGAEAGSFQGSAVPEMPTGDESHLGSVKYWNNYSAGWGIAGNTPFPWSKRIASHLGATRNPLVVAWPARIHERGGLRTQYTHVTDVAATLLEVAGISMPDTVDGVKQLPLDGVSFAYSFDNPEAPSRHRQQYYEIQGNRAMYQDGWIAAARHISPWDPIPPVSQHPDSMEAYAHDEWELYHLDDDFTESRNVARKYPAKVAELKRLFDEQARSNDVYPLMTNFKYGNMPPTQRNMTYTFSPGTSVVAFNSPIAVSNALSHDGVSNFRIDADVVIPDGGAEGVIVFDGERHFGGFVLYLKGDHLVYELDPGAGRLMTLRSQVSLPRGKAVFSLEVGRHRDNNNAEAGVSRLYFNGQAVGEMATPPMQPIFFGNFSVGEAFAALSDGFQPPFKFTGTLSQLRVTVPENLDAHGSESN